MSLYVYCLGDELSESDFEGLTGVSGAAVRLLSLKGPLSAVVSAAPDEPVAVTEENLQAHNRVNAAALAVSTPLPFRFGTRAAPERLAEYAATNEAALNGALARVRGTVEMGVKLLSKAEGEGLKAQGGSEGGSEDLAPAESAVGRGTAFLLKKRREALGGEEARLRAEGLAAWLAEGVAGLARESAVRVNPSEAIIVRAAHLVVRESVEEYRARLRGLRAARADVRLLASGPWPPYSFSDVTKQSRERS
ncbi:MAG: GvpL/GvpF family gas vesicle protein [Pyrinomonadaceae bacterium]